MMIKGFLEIARLPDDPIMRLCGEMNWSFIFSKEDLDLLDQFVSIMGPMETLFSRLNSD